MLSGCLNRKPESKKQLLGFPHTIAFSLLCVFVSYCLLCKLLCFTLNWCEHKLLLLLWLFKSKYSKTEFQLPFTDLTLGRMVSLISLVKQSAKRDISGLFLKEWLQFFLLVHECHRVANMATGLLEAPTVMCWLTPNLYGRGGRTGPQEGWGTGGEKWVWKESGSLSQSLHLIHTGRESVKLTPSVDTQGVGRGRLTLHSD